MYRTIRRVLALAGTAGVLAITGAGAAHATTSYLGPVYPAPGGNTFTPSGDIASAGGETWQFGGFDTSQFGQMVWGPWDANSVKLSFDATADTSYSQPGEVLQYDSADSDLANGKIVFAGHASMSIWNGAGYSPTSFDTRFTLLATDLSNTPISLIDPSSLGLDGGIGGQVSVNDNLSGYKVNMLFEASPNGVTWTPAKDLFNSIGTSTGTDPGTIHTSFDAGFYYTSPAAPLTITPQPYDFGTVVVGSPGSTQAFTLQNTSPNTIQLSNFSAAGDTGDFSPTGSDCGEAPMASGDSCTVDIHFAPLSAGAKSVTYTISDASLDTLGSFTATGTGVVAATLSASPSDLDFGDVLAGTNSGKQTVTISNTGGVDATSFGLVISGPNASAFHLLSTTCGSTLAANSSCTATVRFRASGIGDRSATLTASSPDASAVVTMDGTAIASADVQTDISESPESPVTSGQQVTWTITVWNTGPAPAKKVTMADPLPAGTRFVSLTTSKGKCKSPHPGTVGTVVCSLGEFQKNGTPVTVTITGTITASTGQTITNTETVSSPTHDPHPENNTASIDTDVS